MNEQQIERLLIKLNKRLVTVYGNEGVGTILKSGLGGEYVTVEDCILSYLCDYEVIEFIEKSLTDEYYVEPDNSVEYGIFKL